LLSEYKRLFPSDDFGTLRFVWVGDFLIRAAVAGALIQTPQRLHDGMLELARDNARSFGASLLGRSLFRLLSRDPKRLTQQATASTRQTTSYGRWSAEYPDSHTVVIKMKGEYVWIESYLKGACLGTYESLGQCSVEAELDDPFNGRLIVRWVDEDHS